MTDRFVDVYDEFAQEKGTNSQITMCIEEMSELTKELCKFSRFSDNFEKRSEIVNNIKEEIADVLNMVEQLEYIFGAEDIEKIRDEKINRSKKIFS